MTVICKLIPLTDCAMVEKIVNQSYAEVSMNKQQLILYICLLTVNFASANSIHAWFADMKILEEQIDQQMQQMKQSVKEMQKQFKHLVPQSSLWIAPSYQNITLNQDKDSIIITISDIETDNLEARLNEAGYKLALTTPTNKITIATRNNIVSIEAQETVQKRYTENEVKKETAPHYFGTSITRMERSVRSRPILEKQTIDYNPEKKELVITIPMQPINKGNKVPINIISTQNLKKPERK